MKKYKNLKEFYPYYLTEHAGKANKTVSLYWYCSIYFFFLARFLITLDPMNVIFALLSGYGFAWVSHFFIEKNKPATFTYPFFSLLSDYIMFWEILRGKHKIF